MTLAEYMRALAEVPGWASLSTPDLFGVYRVPLEDDLNAVFLALGDRLIVMRGVVVTLADAVDVVEETCAKAARLQVAVVRERPSILTLEEAGVQAVAGEEPGESPRLVCFRQVPTDVPSETFVQEVQGWLNDYSWWKSTLSRDQGQDSGAGSSLFSLKNFSGLKL